MVLPIKDVETARREKAYHWSNFGLVVVIRGHEEWHRLNLRVIGGVAQGGVGGVQGLRRGRHVDGDGIGLDGQVDVDGRRLVDEEFGDLGLSAKACRGNSDGVFSGRDLGELIRSSSVGGCAEGFAGIVIGDADCGAGNKGPAGILDGSAKRGSCSLGEVSEWRWKGCTESIHPQRDRFTSVPPKTLICGCDPPLGLKVPGTCGSQKPRTTEI